MKNAKDIDEIPRRIETRDKKVIPKISFDYSNIQKHWKENINDVENKFRTSERNLEKSNCFY